MSVGINHGPAYSMTYVAFLVVPGRKGEVPPLNLLQKVAALVVEETYGVCPSALPVLNQADYIFGFDGGSDWVSVYGVRWVLGAYL